MATLPRDKDTGHTNKNCVDIVTTGDIFEELERQMELKINWDNDQAIFHAFTDAEINKNLNVIYEEFKDRCSYVCGYTNNPMLYFMRKKLIPKDKADNLESEYITLDQQIIQRATIFKATNLNDVNLESSG